MELNHLSSVMRGLDVMSPDETLDPRIQLFAKKMDRRVKPGDDDRDSIRVKSALVTDGGGGRFKSSELFSQ